MWRGGLIDVWVAQRWTTAFILVPWRVGLFLMSYYWQTPEAGSSRPGNGTWQQWDVTSLSLSEFNLTVRKCLLKCHSARPSHCLGCKKAGWFCEVQTQASWISICWNLLWFQWIFSLKQDFISPQCYQKLQTSYICSPKCVLYPISVKFQQCLIVFLLSWVTPCLMRNVKFCFLSAQRILRRDLWVFYCKYSIKCLDRMRMNGVDWGTLACKSESTCFKLWHLNNSVMDHRKIGTEIHELTHSLVPSFLCGTPWGSHFGLLRSSCWVSCNEFLAHVRPQHCF